MSTTTNHEDVEAFNDACPIGTRILAFPGSREGRALMTRTRSEAWLLGSGEPVVMVEGYPGGIALTHIERVSEPEWWCAQNEEDRDVPCCTACVASEDKPKAQLAEAEFHIQQLAESLHRAEQKVERMEVLADQFDAKGRRGSAHFGADIGDTIRLWLDRDPRGECNHAPEHVTSDGTRWPLICDVCRTAAPEETDA